jgi:predicted nucleotidyltransferase
MISKIQDKLSETERLNGVRILYACESGSRAWGFTSTDSDYDVRFIYAASQNDYLSINERRDTIDLPVNEVLDVNGWDLRKALRLFEKSNVPLYEWLQSPIVYRENVDFTRQIKPLMRQCFSLRKGMHHYLGMAKNAFSDLQSEEVRIKRYFYCLRPLLAGLWIIDKRELPPMEFSVLRTLILDDEWQNLIDDLLVVKSKADEKTSVKQIPYLHAFAEKSIVYCSDNIPDDDDKENVSDMLNILFREQIHEIRTST